jgi:hypothetical protein
MRDTGDLMSKDQDLKAELISDHELRYAEDDRLGHQIVAEELCRLVQLVETPSNIALYGPWGSGKSSIGSLLSAHLARSNDQRIKLIKFDAFKFAETPLRRNFISAVASDLGIRNEKYHSDLYRGRTSTSYKIPAKGLLNLLKIFSLALCLVSLAVAAVASLAALFLNGPYWNDLGRLLNTNLRAGIAPAALLAAVAAVAGKSLAVEHKIERASSDEEFARLFKDLVEDAGTDRLVIFVDELDRCSSEQVVSALDSIRTFFDVPHCVFVVAADQQVMEEALSERVKQATPTDIANPYYSAGSAYLDKIFQYQVAVPPLLSQSVSKYATDLARGREGIWSRVDVDVIVSILIPSHVRSPRRVKALLNGFALTFRLAHERTQRGFLDTEILSRVEELAKLVCLRQEFPLFARDLVLEAKLPDYVLQIANADSAEVDLGVDVPPSLRKLAEKYAHGTAEVSQLLIDDKDKPGVRASQSRQLLDYLRRTSGVVGPSRDLIHMQSAGSLFGLSAVLAEELETAASNADLRQIRGSLSRMSLDGKRGALQLLVQQLRTSIGIEADNLVSAIISAAEEIKEVGNLVDSVIEAIAPALARNPALISGGSARGVWELSLLSNRAAARSMRSAVLMGNDVIESDSLGLAVMARSGEALDAEPLRLKYIVLYQLFSGNAVAAGECLSKLDSATSDQVLQILGSALSDLLRDAIDVETNNEKGTTSAAPRMATLLVERPDGLNEEVEVTSDVSDILTSLGDWQRSLSEPELTDAGHHLVRLLLAVDRLQTRNVVEQQLKKPGAVRDESTAVAVMVAAQKRKLKLWPIWLNSIAPAAVLGPVVDDTLTDLFTGLWKKVMEDGAKPEEIESVGRAVRSMLETRPPEQWPNLEPMIRESFDGDEDDDIDVASLNAVRQLVAAQKLVAADVIKGSLLAKVECHRLISIFGRAVPLVDEQASAVEYVTWSLPRTLSGWVPEGATPTNLELSDAQALMTSLADCSWLPEPARTTLVLIGISVARETSAVVAIPKAEEVSSLLADHGQKFDSSAARWIEVATPSVDDVLTALRSRLQKGNVGDALLAALSERVAALSPGQQFELIEPFVEDHRQPLPADSVLSALGISSCSEQDMGRLLLHRYSKCTNNTQREEVLVLWRLAQVASPSARRKLVEGILVPLFRDGGEGRNDGALRVALKYFPSLAHPIPTGMKKSLREVVIASTKHRAELLKSAESALISAGYLRRRVGFLGLRSEIVDDES